MENRGAGLHRFRSGEHAGQRFVFHLNHTRRFFRNMRAHGGHGRDGVALVEHFFSGQDVSTNIAERRGAFPQVNNAVAGAGQVRRRHRGFHSRQRGCFGRVNTADAGVSVGAANDAAMQQPRQAKVGAILRAAGNFIGAVVTNGTRADDRILPAADPSFRRSLGLCFHAFTFCSCAAACSTARTILS